MEKIVKRHGFWQRRGWILLVCVNVLLQTIVNRNNPYWWAIMIALCAVAIYFFVFRKGDIGDYISWNHSILKVQEDGQEYEFTSETIDQISFGNNHLWIKSGAANGLLVNLKGYSFEDVEHLKSELGQQSIIQLKSLSNS